MDIIIATRNNSREIALIQKLYGEEFHHSFRGRTASPYAYNYFTLYEPPYPDFRLKTSWMVAGVNGVMLANSEPKSWLYQQDRETENGWVSHFLQYKLTGWQTTSNETLLVSAILEAEWDMEVKTVKKKGVSISVSVNGGPWKAVARQDYVQMMVPPCGLALKEIELTEFLPHLGEVLQTQDLYLRFPKLKTMFTRQKLTSLLDRKMLNPERKRLSEILGVNPVLWPYIRGRDQTHITLVSVNGQTLDYPSCAQVLDCYQRATKALKTNELKALRNLFQATYPSLVSIYSNSASFWLFMRLFLKEYSSKPFSDALEYLRNQILKERLRCQKHRERVSGVFFDAACFILLKRAEGEADILLSSG